MFMSNTVNPITVELDDIPEDVLAAVKQNDWSEPPSDAVTALRDALTPRLRRLTPDTVDWSERRALHVLAHVRARREVRALPDWRSEVMAARRERDALRPEGDRPLDAIVPERLNSPALDAAHAVAKRLEAHGLDGRDLNQDGRGLRRNSTIAVAGGILRIAQFLPFLSVFLLSMGVQSTLGYVKGNSTDEGVDARTTYHFVFALFASMIVWPLVAAGLAGGAYATGALDPSGMPELAAVALFVLCFPVFVLSGWSFAIAWDGWVVLRGGLRRAGLRGRQGVDLRNELDALHAALAG